MPRKCDPILQDLPITDLDRLHTNTQNRIAMLQGYKSSKLACNGKAGYFYRKYNPDNNYKQENDGGPEFTRKILQDFSPRPLSIAAGTIIFLGIAKDSFTLEPSRIGENFLPGVFAGIGSVIGGAAIGYVMPKLAYRLACLVPVESWICNTKLANNKEKLAIISEEYKKRDVDPSLNAKKFRLEEFRKAKSQQSEIITMQSSEQQPHWEVQDKPAMQQVPSV